MDTNEARAMGYRALAEARALRTTFPDAGAMASMPISDFTATSLSVGGEGGRLSAALGYLRDEMLVVRAGRAADLTVLDDEIAGVERLLRQI